MKKIPKNRKILFWSQRKISIQTITKLPSFNEGEIWWAAIGENIGIEINGKSSSFTRPTLILHKYSEAGFFAIPLTSQKHSGKWYFRFKFQGKISYAALTQGRTLSTLRLNDRIGSIPGDLLDKIHEAYIKSLE